MGKIINCRKCNLYKNQPPLIDELKSSDIMWVGLSAKPVGNCQRVQPLAPDTNSGKIIAMIERECGKITFYRTNLVKCVPLNENQKLRYPVDHEMKKCCNNLLLELSTIKPKSVILLGKQVAEFIIKLYNLNPTDKIKYSNYCNTYYKNGINFIHVHHPSYMYVYKKKHLTNYVSSIVETIKLI